jgi:NitT/TauT family transport system permease protein
MSRFLRVTIKQVIFYFCLLLFWHFLFVLKLWPEYLFPAPLKVFKTLLAGFRDQAFIISVLISLRRVLIGFGISVISGTVIGILMRRIKIFNETFGKLVMGIQTLPSICWFPLAILWFGLTETTIIFIVVMGSLFSVTISVYTGLKHIPSIYLQTARNMGARRMKMLWWVLIPAAAPSLIIGLKQGWSFAWRSLMAGELLFVCLGLGFLLMMARELNDISQVIAVIILIMIISVLIDKFIFGIIESRIKRRWGFEEVQDRE